MSVRRSALDAAGSYLKQHPEELARAARNALGLRFGLPVAALRWLASQRDGATHGPRDITVDAEPPGIRVAATVELMGATVRAQSTIFVERVRFVGDESKLELRLEHTQLQLLDDTVSNPVGALIRSGALDLTKAGELARHLPQLRGLLSESHGNRLVLDLAKHPAFARGSVGARWLALANSLVTVQGVASDERHVDVMLRAFPGGVRAAGKALRESLSRRAPPWIQGMLPPR